MLNRWQLIVLGLGADPPPAAAEEAEGSATPLVGVFWGRFGVALKSANLAHATPVFGAVDCPEAPNPCRHGDAHARHALSEHAILPDCRPSDSILSQ